MMPDIRRKSRSSLAAQNRTAFVGGEGAAASVMPAINVENDSTFLPLEMGLCATRTMILPPVARRT
jgi:hypothetical protein